MADFFDFANFDFGTGGGSGSAVTPTSKVVEKDGFVDVIKAIGDGYTGAVQSYYTAKGAVADARLTGRGNPYTQFVSAGQGAFSIPPTNLLLFGGLGLAAILLLSGGGGRRR